MYGWSGTRLVPFCSLLRTTYNLVLLPRYVHLENLIEPYPLTLGSALPVMSPTQMHQTVKPDSVPVDAATRLIYSNPPWFVREPSPSATECGGRTTVHYSALGWFVQDRCTSSCPTSVIGPPPCFISRRAKAWGLAWEPHCPRQMHWKWHCTDIGGVPLDLLKSLSGSAASIQLSAGGSMETVSGRRHCSV